MQTITPTLVGLLDAFAQLYGQEDTISEDYWVNTALNIPPLGTGTGARTIMAYMLGLDGRVDRSARRFMPYQPVPLIHRPLSNPLTPAERAGLCLRTIKTINGIQYEFYYGRWLPPIPAPTLTQYTNTATPTLPYLSQPLNLPPPTMNFDGLVARPTAVTLSSVVTLPYTTIDQYSLEQACLALGITAPQVKELGLLAGRQILDTLGGGELDQAICSAHVSLSNALTPPGIQLTLGQTMGLAL